MPTCGKYSDWRAAYIRDSGTCQRWDAPAFRLGLRHPATPEGSLPFTAGSFQWSDQRTVVKVVWMKSFVLIAALGACATDDPLPVGEHHSLTVTGLAVATNSTSARDTGIDLSGDGSRDNQLGQVFATMVGTLGQNFDVNAATTADVGAGRIRLGLDLQTSDLANAQDAGLTVLIDQTPSDVLAGKIVGSQLHASGDGTVAIELGWPGGDPLRLELDNARAELNLATHHGTIGGGVALTAIHDQLMPRFLASANAQIAFDCPRADAPPDCGCETNSAGQLLLDFGAHTACSLSLANLEGSDFMHALTKPDLAADHVSFGIGITVQ